jgi:uncharacterized protein (TIGR02117 family)
MLRQIFRILVKSLAYFALFILVYFLFAYGLSSIPVNSNFKQSENDGVEVYILTNGVHADIVVPVRNQYMDWSTFVNQSDTKAGGTDAKNIAFGWGDKGFYLNTPTWPDLKFSTAFKALFYLSSSAMHVTFYSDLKESASCRKISITNESYINLTKYIVNSFDLNEEASCIQIRYASYSDNDAFYEAKGKYSLFYTCNTWTNCGLKAAGMKACVWTPFQDAIFDKY